MGSSYLVGSTYLGKYRTRKTPRLDIGIGMGILTSDSGDEPLDDNTYEDNIYLRDKNIYEATLRMHRCITGPN